MPVRATTGPPSPLADIEARVQGRAKDMALDVGSPAGAQRLRELIDDEVGRWRDDHRRGLHDVDVVDPDGVADRAFAIWVRDPGAVADALDRPLA